MKKSSKINEIDIEATGSWTQTWANFYSHITRNMDAEKTHATLAKERANHMKTITHAEEHLKGINLFYSQSHLADPAHQCAEEKGDVRHPLGPDDQIEGHTRELSDREI